MPKFGLSQFKQETPQIIVRLQAALSFFFAGLLPFVGPLGSAFKTTSETISMVIGIALLFTNTIAMFFGVEVSGTNKSDTDSNG